MGEEKTEKGQRAMLNLLTIATGGTIPTVRNAEEARVITASVKKELSPDRLVSCAMRKILQAAQMGCSSVRLDVYISFPRGWELDTLRAAWNRLQEAGFTIRIGGSTTYDRDDPHYVTISW